MSQLPALHKPIDKTFGLIIGIILFFILMPILLVIVNNLSGGNAGVIMASAICIGFIFIGILGAVFTQTAESG